jgi:hypothetical protein
MGPSPESTNSIGFWFYIWRWWGKRDSNPHALRHMILNHARLPIPTFPRACGNDFTIHPRQTLRSTTKPGRTRNSSRVESSMHCLQAADLRAAAAALLGSGVLAGVKTVPASAAGDRIRVADREPTTHEAVYVVDL